MNGLKTVKLKSILTAITPMSCSTNVRDVVKLKHACYKEPCITCGNKRKPNYDVFCGICRWKINKSLEMQLNEVEIEK